MRRIVTLTLLCLLVAGAKAQDGKLRGTIVDNESNDPLVGANVVIEGTSLGASADLSGEYVILGIPPGTYTVRVSYIGYASFTISNIRISSNLTTTQNFRLSTTSIQIEAVDVVADRPLVQRNTTNTVRLVTQEGIENLPTRGVESILALQAGVVQKDGALYVRGGREGEIAYFVDGAISTNPFNRDQTVSVIQEAIEEIQLQSGGFTAEYGGASSGVVNTSVRTGGNTIKATLDILTDDLAKPGSSFLGTSSSGYRNVVATVGGPLPYVNDAKFFLAAQHNYVRNRQHMFLTPFRFEGLVNDVFGGRTPGELLPNNGTVEFKENYLYNNWMTTNTVQGTGLYTYTPFKFKLSGSWTEQKLPVGGQWPQALPNYFNQKRNMIDKNTTRFLNARVTHVLDPETFYEVGLSYSDDFHRTIDPDFGHSWMKYTDSIANAALGYTGFARRFEGPIEYSTILGFSFLHPNEPNNTYSKDRQTSIGLTADFTSQLTSDYELKAGGRITAWTVREYRVGNIERALVYLYGLDGKSPKTFSSPEERRVLLRRQGLINNYGYTVDGAEADEGFDAPRTPLFASAYVQNKLEFKDLILNIGLRYEFYDTRNLMPADLLNPAFDQTLDAIDESKLVEVPAASYFMPRLSFSFPATDQTVFYAQYGRYVQLPELTRIYMGNGYLSQNVSPLTRFPNGRGAGGFTTSFLAKPEQTTQFEVGFRQLITENFAITLSGFYKHVKDLLQYNKFPTLENPLFVTYKNEDFATLKGLELTMDLRRTRRLAMSFNYTLTDAVGTGSDPTDFYVAVSDVTILSRFPVYTTPLSFNQRHRGNLTLDYRFPKGDGGPILEGLGFNVILGFNSGHPYTRIKELTELGQYDAWRVAIRTPSRRTPIEAVNNSNTPWVFNVDLALSKVFYLDAATVEVYANILNLFDAQSIINVYETTGSAQDDGWLQSPLSTSFHSIPQYTDFYRAINLENRWAFMNQFGRDLYGTPRQIRVGLKVEY